MVVYTLFTLSFIKKMGRNKKEHDIFRRKKTEKQNKTMMISVDGIGTVFLVTLKLPGESFE